MIFQQIDEILAGRKTQTRRVCKPGESWDCDSDRPSPDRITVVLTGAVDLGVGIDERRVKWAVGRTYAVVPKRGQPAVWWITDSFGDVSWSDGHITKRAALSLHGWQPARIRILSIRREPLQAITEADAKAEGVESVAAYRDLWESINGKTKGARWADNPDVWALTFELVKGAA